MVFALYELDQLVAHLSLELLQLVIRHHTAKSMRERPMTGARPLSHSENTA